jgi:hypothetical protein
MCPKIGKAVPEAKLDVKETVNSVSLTTKAQRSTFVAAVECLRYPIRLRDDKEARQVRRE